MKHILRKPTSAVLLLLLVLFTVGLPAKGQRQATEKADDAHKQRDFDQPEEEDDLNRELWELARKTPYDEILPYVQAAQRASAAKQTAEVELPNGWRISPAGTQVEVGRLPYEALMFAEHLVVLDTGYYLKEDQAVSIVDVQTKLVTKTLRLHSLFPSAVAGGDGDLYISGGFDQKVFRVNREFKVVREYAVGGFTGGLAALDAKHLAVGYLVAKNAGGGYISGRLAVLNTETGKIEREVSVGYFPYTVRYLAGKLFVTMLGENKLRVFDPQLKELSDLPLGQTPQEVCTDGTRLYVTNTGSDNISVVDIKSTRVMSSINVAQKGSRFGRTPTSCAVEGNRLYVTLAGINAVAVLNKATGKQIGLVPTGWYPTKVLSNDRDLIVLNAKGIRPRRPNPKGPQPIGNSREGDYVLTLLKGTVSMIPKAEIPTKLPSWTRQVEVGSPLFSMKAGFKLPVRHIFYIIKENRSYDQILGDLGRGNGDPALTLFGKDISPIHHQLASEFVTLDNFFVNGEISVLGHSFTTSGYASPFLEWLGNTRYSGRWNGYPFGTVPALTSPAYLWDRLDEKKIDYRIYGENYFLFTRAYRILSEHYGAESVLAKTFYAKSMGTAASVDRGNEFYQFARSFYGQAGTRESAYQLLGKPEFTQPFSIFLTGDGSLKEALDKDEKLRRRFADYLYHYPFNYRSWDLKVSDLDRVKAWKTDFEGQVQAGKVAQLHYIWLPNDHTDGANETILNAFQFVAQNDAALGRIVETISRSPVWKESLILVEEDDAQNGPDHVDATRTVAFAIGPYVKRGQVVSDRYDQLSMLRTMELLLGLEPLNLGDRLAVPMFGVFERQPNFAPFAAVKPSDRLVAADRERFQQLAP
ncbi:MAG: bifunctional YncE family protein/alkaline phosphatase family protein [bacterium]